MALYCLMVFIRKNTQARKYEGLRWHSCSLCMLPNVLVVPSRKNTTIPSAGPICTHFLALYCLMVFIMARKYKGISWHSCTLCVLPNVLVAASRKNTIMRCRLKMKKISKKHQNALSLSYFHPSSGIILLDGVY